MRPPSSWFLNCQPKNSTFAPAIGLPLTASATIIRRPLRQRLVHEDRVGDPEHDVARVAAGHFCRHEIGPGLLQRRRQFPCGGQNASAGGLSVRPSIGRRARRGICDWFFSIEAIADVRNVDPLQSNCLGLDLEIVLQVVEELARCGLRALRDRPACRCESESRSCGPRSPAASAWTRIGPSCRRSASSRIRGNSCCLQDQTGG